MNGFLWRKSGMRPRAFHVVTLTGLSLFAAFTIWKPQHLAAAEDQFSKDQITDEFTSMIKYETEAMETWLSIALHEDVECNGVCNRDENFSSIVPVLIARCERFDPEAQEQSPYYDPSVHGEDLDRIKTACSILTNTAKNTLDPSDQSPLPTSEANSFSVRSSSVSAASDTATDRLGGSADFSSIPESPEWVEAVSQARAVFR